MGRVRDLLAVVYDENGRGTKGHLLKLCATVYSISAGGKFIGKSQSKVGSNNWPEPRIVLQSSIVANFQSKNQP